MPTPTWAELIMFTSFAPSPIAKVVRFSSPSSGFSLTIITISAFCFGDTLQASTTLEFFAKLRNSKSNLSFLDYVILANCSPPMTTAMSLVRPMSAYLFAQSLIYLYNSFVLGASSKKISISSSSSLQLKPMFIAVSILSPVSTQSFTSASLMKLMTLATLSWSLSSMAVHPTSLKPCSIRSATSSSFLSRSLRAAAARA